MCCMHKCCVYVVLLIDINKTKCVVHVKTNTIRCKLVEEIF